MLALDLYIPDADPLGTLALKAALELDKVRLGQAQPGSDLAALLDGLPLDSDDVRWISLFLHLLRDDFKVEGLKTTADLKAALEARIATARALLAGPVDPEVLKFTFDFAIALHRRLLMASESPRHRRPTSPWRR